MNRFWKIAVVVLLVVCTALVTFFATWGYASQFYAPQTPAEQVAAKVEELNACLDYYFVDEYDSEAAAAAAIDGASEAMINATGDRWSYYIPASQMKAYEEMSNNAYVGIGVTIVEVENGMEIATVTEGGPADLAGIQVGDVLTHVDGHATKEAGMDGTVDLVAGEADTPVVLTLQRGEEILELFVYRKEIVSEVAEAQLIDGEIGYIIIYNFDAHCAEQTLACIAEMMGQGAKALLFDVRFNPGGYKDELVLVLDELVPEGITFHQVDYAGEELIDRSDDVYLQMPMAVLVNSESYSAAEYFAAALQEYGVADVVGSKTVGKGNFQYTFEFSDGSGAAISCGKYYTPQGKSLTDVGVTPDVEVDLSEEDYEALLYAALPLEEDGQFQAAVEILRQKIS